MDRTLRRSTPTALLAPLFLVIVTGCGMRPGLRGVGAGPRNAVRLEKALRERIPRSDTSVQVAVSLIDLETGLRLGINDRMPLQSSSSARIPVLIEVFRQAEQGKLSLDDPIAVTNRFVRVTDGSSYSLSPEGDQDSTLYRMIGGQLPVRELIRAMIARSSDLATQLLIERVTPAAMRATLSRLDADDIHVIDDGKNPTENTVTAAALARALDAIARCRLHTRANCDEMVQLLAGDESKDMIPAGLPTGTHVVHVTEHERGIQHDAALVFPGEQKPYVLVILTNKTRDRAQAATIAADLSRTVWNNLTEPPTLIAPRR